MWLISNYDHASAKYTTVSVNEDLNRLNLLLQKGDVSSFLKNLAISMDNAHSISICMSLPQYNKLPVKSGNNMTSGNSNIPNNMTNFNKSNLSIADTFK